MARRRRRKTKSEPAAPEGNKVDKFLRHLKAEFGASSSGVASDFRSLAAIPYGVSTQSLLLDMMIGRPGLPCGRLTEITGLESSSKSTLVDHVLAENQACGGISIRVETESTYDEQRAKTIGVDTDKLIVTQPGTIEKGFEMMEAAIEDAHKDDRLAIAWDSVAGTQTEAEEEADYDHQGMAAHARALSRGLRKLVPLIGEKKICLLFVNQMKTNVGGYGPKYVSFGGKAIPFHASLRIQLSKGPLEKDGDSAVGMWFKGSTIKNKVSSPFQETEFLVLFRTGLDMYQDLLEAGKSLGIIRKKGGWYRFRGVEKPFNRRNFPDFVKEHFKSIRRLRRRLTRIAIKHGRIAPYGSEE